LGQLVKGLDTASRCCVPIRFCAQSEYLKRPGITNRPACDMRPVFRPSWKKDLLQRVPEE
jgi:hypothetical protein